MDESPQDIRTPEKDHEFTKQLAAFGIPEEGISVLVARFFDKLSYREIVQRQHFVDENAVRYLIRVLLRDLRQKGFRFKDEA